MITRNVTKVKINLFFRMGLILVMIFLRRPDGRPKKVTSNPKVEGETY